MYAKRLPDKECWTIKDSLRLVRMRTWSKARRREWYDRCAQWILFRLNKYGVNHAAK